MLRPYKHSVTTLQIEASNPRNFLHLDKQGVERTRPPVLVE